jgi:hypothetical protein
MIAMQPEFGGLLSTLPGKSALERCGDVTKVLTLTVFLGFDFRPIISLF